MRVFISITLACGVWLMATQAIALEAIISAADDFCCHTSGIWVSAEGSTGWDEVDEVSWDFDNNGTWEINGGDPGVYGTVLAEWTTGDVYTIKLKIVDNDAPAEDTTTASPFYVGEPIIATPTYEVRAGVPVTFNGTGSRPTSMYRSYQWDYEYSGGTPSWDSTSGQDNWTFSAGYYTVLLRVTFGNPVQGYCETTCVIHAT